MDIIQWKALNGNKGVTVAYRDWCRRGITVALSGICSIWEDRPADEGSQSKRKEGKSRKECHIEGRVIESCPAASAPRTRVEHPIVHRRVQAPVAWAVNHGLSPSDKGSSTTLSDNETSTEGERQSSNASEKVERSRHVTVFESQGLTQNYDVRRDRLITDGPTLTVPRILDFLGRAQLVWRCSTNLWDGGKQPYLPMQWQGWKQVGWLVSHGTMSGSC